MKEVITASGHPGVTARHGTTFMTTKDRDVGPNGDCIIAVGADKAVSDLSSDLKRAIKSGRRLYITLKARGMVEKIRARGHPSLSLDHPADMVVRKSEFICGRTLAIGADKAAADLHRKFVAALRDPSTKLEMEIEISVTRPAACEARQPRGGISSRTPRRRAPCPLV